MDESIFERKFGRKAIPIKNESDQKRLNNELFRDSKKRALSLLTIEPTAPSTQYSVHDLTNQQSQLVHTEEQQDPDVPKATQPYIDTIFKKEEGVIDFPRRMTRKPKFSNIIVP